jgi:hypothetical protein
MTNLDPTVVGSRPTKPYRGESLRRQGPKYDPLSGESRPGWALFGKVRFVAHSSPVSGLSVTRNRSLRRICQGGREAAGKLRPDLSSDGFFRPGESK